MEFLKKLFGDKSLTFDDFKAAVEADKSIKLANLADGKYVDKEKLDKKTAELQTANDTIKRLQSDGADIEQMKRTIADYQTKEQRRIDDEKAADELKALKNRFSPLKGDKAFLNEGTENWIFNEFKNALTLDENKGKSDSEIYEAIIKDKNIYESPNKVAIPPVGKLSTADEAEKQKAREIMGLNKD